MSSAPAVAASGTVSQSIGIQAPTILADRPVERPVLVD